MSSYSVPIDASFYDNLPNGFYHMPYTSQFGSQAEAVSQESYYLPPTGGEPVPSYPTYNGLPPFQTPPLLPSTTPSVEAPASWEPSWNHSSGSVSDDLSQLQPNAVTAVAQHGTRRRGSSSRLATYSRRTTSSRRTKIKKASCTGYAAKLKEFPVDAQQALMRFYDCCANINREDNSTLHKHRLSTRHFRNTPKRFQDMQPTHVCPAFLALHFLCKNAKPGRYDAGIRHCESCPGFEEMVEHYCEEGQTLVPVEVTRREFEAIQEFRKNAQPDEESDSPIVVNAALKVLAMIRSQTHSGAPDGDVTTDAQQDPMLNDSDDVVHDYGLEDGVY